MEIKDLAGFAEPITKLIEVVAAGCGRVTRSYFARKDAETKAYEMKVLAQTEYEIKQLYGSSDSVREIQLIGTAEIDNTNPPLLERASSRNEYQEAVRQQNLESVCAIAAEDLLHESQVPEEKPSQEWINRFFNSAEEISSEELQFIWGKILAGEIKRPRSFSLRTLETLRNVSKEEAEIFQNLSSYIASTRKGGILPAPGNFHSKHVDFLFEVDDDEIRSLVDAGLFLDNQAEMHYTEIFNKHGYTYLKFGEIALIIVSSGGGGVVLKSKSKYYFLTKAGSELLRLISDSVALHTTYIKYVIANDLYSESIIAGCSEGSLSFFLAPVDNKTGLPNLNEKTPFDISRPYEEEK
ncbi:DUF2806 domain-containing protein [Oscillatoria sp. FACHB-1407]|uniref:DUF2806 domain-containing protein n=1 Tax=Oscillatoria sp. FACHB-1407 TaxID=2692847 RepID=UPI0016890175|nr:DUF2806 domain-containing protein [Oscillatoria sp. FACHB-1407]MBD2464112.1 DUF2806 domain-containing protein [Oscillatoria sp. FACHB-1407]